jgi:uncharacterized surface protein with fasciclin (FAS1) repeats
VSRRLFVKAAGVVAAGAVLHACGGGGGSDDDGGAPIGSDTLLERLQQDSDFSLLLEAVARAGLEGTIGAAGAGLTLFAPPNSAFDALASRIGQGSGSNLVGALTPTQWASILRFALVPQTLPLTTLNTYASNDTRPQTLYEFQGIAARLIFVPDNGTLTVWDGVGRTSIAVTDADINASNGVMHVVSDVLLPRGVLTVSQMVRANIDSFSRFAASLTPSIIAELDGRSACTVFVPSDALLPAPLSDTRVVRFHVATTTLGDEDFPSVNNSTTLSTLIGRSTTLTTRENLVIGGRSVLAQLTDATASPANVTDVDFYASNGVIHVLDRALVPPP